MKVETVLSRMCLALRRQALKNQGPPNRRRILFSVISLGEEASRWNRGRRGGGSCQNYLRSNINSVPWKQWSEAISLDIQWHDPLHKEVSDSSLLGKLKNLSTASIGMGLNGQLVIWVLEKTNTYREWTSQSRIYNLVVQLKKSSFKARKHSWWGH